VFRLGRVDDAHALLDESLAIGRAINDVWAIVFSQWSLGTLALVKGDLALARSLFEDGMPKIVGLANKWAVAYGLEAFGYLAAASAQVVPAVRLFGAAQALRDAIGAPLPPANRADFEQVTAGLRLALGEESFAGLWAAGRALSWEEAARFALEEW
jgi:hypothetical protein